MKSWFRLLPTCGLVLLVGGMGGCGNPGAPEPPSLWLPVPVKDLAAQRTGNSVLLTWTMSSRTTDQLGLKKEQTVIVCRAVGKALCVPAGRMQTEPGMVAHFRDVLPSELATGGARLLSYTVRLQNRSGRDAGASNRAFSAAGGAPPDVQAVQAQTTANGILVDWSLKDGSAPEKPPNALLFASLLREWIPAKGEKTVPTRAETDAGVPQTLQQALATPETIAQGKWSPTRTLDAQVRLNRTYRYTVQLAQQEAIEGHSVTVLGASAVTAPLDAKDVFAPDIPQGLDAAADPEGAAIDLSWSPSSSLDTAGYFVYRRREGDAGAATRVSGKAPLPAPAWSDRSAKPGVRYAYSVSAIDTSGNESAPSATVDATLPEK